MTLNSKGPHDDSTLTKIRVFIGIYTLTVSTSVYAIWGNLSAYVISYFHFRVQDGTDFNSTWVIPVYATCWGLGMMMCHKLTGWIGLRSVCVVGSLLYSVSMSLCYFSVQHSSVTFYITFGMAPGLGFGLMQGCVNLYVIMWTRRYVSLATSFISTCQMLGGCVLNILITWYINPSNLSADIKETTHGNLFSQDDLLDRVPRVFIIYGSTAFSFGLIAFCLIRDKKKKMNEEKMTSKKVEKSLFYTAERKYEESNAKKTSLDLNTYSTADTKENSNEKSNNNISSCEKKHLIINVNSDDMSLSKAMKTKIFYVLLIMIAYADISSVVLFTYYKVFGMVYFSDDHFLTSESIILSIGMAVSVHAVGSASEKFNLKNTLVVLNFILCFMSCFLYVSARLREQWLYLIWVVGYGSCLYATFSMCSICVLRYFGKTYSTTIIGITLSFTNVVNTSLSPVINYILTSYGWLTLFTINSVINVIGFCVIVWGLPYKTKY